MDLPANFEQWQWQEHEVTAFQHNTAYELMAPKQPDWRAINRWYPECKDSYLGEFWVCPIEGVPWSFFLDKQRNHWILMPLVPISTDLPDNVEVPFGLDMKVITYLEDNSREFWTLFADAPIEQVKQQIQQRLESRFARDSIERLEVPNSSATGWHIQRGGNRHLISVSVSENAGQTFIGITR